jgi:hypothetical protein
MHFSGDFRWRHIDGLFAKFQEVAKAAICAGVGMVLR